MAQDLCVCVESSIPGGGRRRMQEPAIIVIIPIYILCDTAEQITLFNWRIRSGTPPQRNDDSGLLHHLLLKI
jgi:hypothetical protein